MRLLITVLLKAGMIVVLNWIGWIKLMSDGHPAQWPKEVVGIAIIVAIIFMIVTVLTLTFSCFIAAILWVFLGGFILWIMARVASDFIELNAGFWLTALSGFLILAVRMPERKEEVVVQ